MHWITRILYAPLYSQNLHGMLLVIIIMPIEPKVNFSTRSVKSSLHIQGWQNHSSPRVVTDCVSSPASWRVKAVAATVACWQLKVSLVESWMSDLGKKKKAFNPEKEMTARSQDIPPISDFSNAPSTVDRQHVMWHKTDTMQIDDMKRWQQFDSIKMA